MAKKLYVDKRAILNWRVSNRLPFNKKPRKFINKLTKKLENNLGEEDILRGKALVNHFFRDLLKYSKNCPEPDVVAFIATWRKIYGVR